jgi:hypothetical protein
VTAAELSPAGEDRAVGRVVELASGLLMLLDEHGITGRLPLDARAQTSRLRHAVKLAAKATATAPSSRNSRSPAPTLWDPAGALQAWIASQPWAAVDSGPVGWVYLLCFRDPRTGQHRPLKGNGARGQFAGHYWGKPASSGLLKVLRRADGAEFAQLAWPAGLRPRGAAGAPPTPRHGVPVVGVCELGAVVTAAVVLGTVPAGAVVVGTATGAVVVGTATVVVGADRDGEVVDVAGARVAGGAGLSASATTTPTEVLAPCGGRLPTKLASGCCATASMPVIAPTAIPNASTAATATRRQRIGSGCALLAPSSLGPAPLPTRRRRERRARVSADASVRVYTASAGVTRMLPSAAPMRVPSTPKNDATTAPVTAASAPASNLGTRSCSIPHLQVGDGGRRRCRGGPQARPDGSPAAPASARILPTKAVSCQVAPSQEGDRAAWDSCSAGDRVCIAAVAQRAQFKAAQAPEGPKVAHDLEHVGPRRVHESQRDCTVSDRRAEILLGDQESCSSMRACRARWLSRDNARAALSNALTNSRQIQHWTIDLVRRITREHRNPNWTGPGRLIQVALAAGLTFELAWLEYPATRGRERRLKSQGSAYRRCPLCRGTGGPLDPAAAAAAVLRAGGAR